MSDEVKANIKGYHVNDIERCSRFLEENEYLITSEDKHWLGYGMYFWDNSSNANYWLKQKERKEPTKKYIKVNANIFICEELLLDLTDNAVVERLQLLWEMYCKRRKESKDQPLGIKIDKMITFYDMLKSIELVRAIGDYDILNTKENSFFKIGGYDGPQVSANLKNIYCARKHHIVVNRIREELIL